MVEIQKLGIKLIITTLFVLTVNSQSCLPQCLTCKSASVYACTSCQTTSGLTSYVFSCQNLSNQKSPLFVVLCVLVVGMHVFMLVMGHGIYRQIYEGIQMASLISWGYGSQSGAYVLQGTNLGLEYNNSFWLSFSPQFIVIMAVWCIFWIFFLAAYRYPHNPTATLILRKRAIFPTRLFTFFFNMIIYSALINVTTNSSSMVTFGYVLSILALFKVFLVWLGILLGCNLVKYSWNDPNYYVFIEKLTSTKWYMRNLIIISMLVRAIIIVAYVLSFSQPRITGIIIMVMQAVYCLYMIVLIRYTSRRYYIGNVVGNLLVLGIYGGSYGCAINAIGSAQWNSFRLLYMVLLIVLCCWLILMAGIQVILNRLLIHRQILSLYLRFIKCQKTQLNRNRFDENFEREKVTQFKQNLMHQTNVSELSGIYKQSPL